MLPDLRYKYKGFEYRTFDDVEEDNIKTFHYCYKDGKEIKMSYEFYNTSPYELVAVEDFKKFVDTLEVFIQSKEPV
jgi:uncharacterized protein YacL (UPF0231 family)